MTMYVTISFWYRRMFVILLNHIVIFRPLKVEIYRSTVSTDGFHTKSISVSNTPKIPTYYRVVFLTGPPLKS